MEERKEVSRDENRGPGNNRERNDRGGDDRNRRPQGRVQIPRFVFRKKKCRLCESKMKEPDYKDIDFLSRFYTDRGKILPRRITGCCAKHQRKVKVAIKRARYMAILPFAKIEIIKK
ncbi:MAG: 30S ribosomal protein S18 [Spirochaetae bacterium HGW-Spirochaetae-6]|nr:MAG: 30S ribosomal protein S18 [Spirochaetae bacterium HGW-Spirochaetae-6]